ncbi:MAG: ParB N-terminal domain-containing protein [Rhodobacteraceae bacterium]|nr:ParB N-terminal domain-containing protein [Paracoccaceae bacterium]
MAKSKPQAKSSVKPAAEPAPILDIQMIPVSKLTLCPRNVRKTPASKQEDAELYASIKAIGLKQNLLIHAVGDKYLVHAGGRRLYTVQQLIKDKHCKTTHQVPCVVEDADRAEETSAAENMIRAKMHPADEFVAFAGMRKNGRTEREIATKFGITVNTVHQRLKLAGVAPEIMDAFRNDDMSLECVMAFTLAKDHARQVEVLRATSQEYQMQA